MSYKSTPKVELHLHFEGAAPPDFIRQLAFEQKVDLSKIFNEDCSYKYRDFDHFLEVYEAATSVLKTPEHFARLCSAVLERSAENGVVYCETFLSPDFCGGADVSAWREYLHAIEEAAAKADRDMGITLRGIVTPIRHFGPEQAKKAALCAAETKGDFIVGLGMGGAEMMHRPGDFAYSFDMGREAGLRLTCHAGEWGGPDMVADTIRDLKVERIGHGINAIKDRKLVDDIAEAGIVLEVCPGSNVFLGASGQWADHPIKPLRDAGVKVTVSTDDPPFFHTTMTKEYDMLAQTFGWGDDDFAELNKTAIEAAFCDAATRDIIIKRLETAQ
ncbi:adenosine deaminase [Marivivens donghaensis]|uniref:adenosine deaminase n=1 Tax=Marivivens donghaensis TaxID=1699413 RepID=UPI00201F4202|nr:adenosine deaminase [Marivivens donghaensis]MCL7409192.1 adenosine deaminase [Marivivens donghaensis]MDN3703510.1 adenosine deaminase [Marivivens donghaensis]